MASKYRNGFQKEYMAVKPTVSMLGGLLVVVVLGVTDSLWISWIERLTHIRHWVVTQIAACHHAVYLSHDSGQSAHDRPGFGPRETDTCGDT